MGFRSDDEALRQRVDALTGEVAEKDAEVARLKAELEAARTAVLPHALKVDWALPHSPSQTEPTEDTETWALPLQLTSWRTWVPFLGPAAVVGPMAVYFVRQGMATTLEALAIALFFGAAPALVLLYRGGIVLDRNAQTITTWRWFLIRWSTTLPVDGRQSIVVEQDRHLSSKGESFTIGRIKLGDRFLLQRRWPEARSVAERIARFVGAPFEGVQQRRRKRRKA